jgi:hypothetical protein
MKETKEGKEGFPRDNVRLNGLKPAANAMCTTGDGK